jgi:Mg/Co/Ni transporter MgtE
LRWLLRHPAHAVGAWTDAGTFTLTADLTAGEALARLRESSCGDDSVYVLDRDRRLAGVASVAMLLGADPDAAVAGLMAPAPAPLLSQAALTTAVGLAAWRPLSALPVVDWRQRFVGVLRSGDLERGLRRYPAPPAGMPLSDSLMEASELYWSGMAAVLRAVLALLAAPAARKEE